MAPCIRRLGEARVAVSHRAPAGPYAGPPRTFGEGRGGHRGHFWRRGEIGDDGGGDSGDDGVSGGRVQQKEVGKTVEKLKLRAWHGSVSGSHCLGDVDMV